MRLVHIALPITRALLVAKGLDFVRDLVEQEIRKQIAGQHPGYAADELTCLSLYHWPHPEQADWEMVAAAYAYSLIRAPLTA
jgi:hypothetical protein